MDPLKSIFQQVLGKHFDSATRSLGVLTLKTIDYTITTSINTAYRLSRWYKRLNKLEEGSLYRFKGCGHPMAYRKTKMMILKNEATGVTSSFPAYETVELEKDTICMFLRYLPEEGGDADYLMDKIEVLANEEVLIIGTQKKRHPVERKCPEEILVKVHTLDYNS